MKPTLAAIIATCIAMLATSGIVVFATAATSARTATASDQVGQELQAEIDTAITRQLNDVKVRLRGHP